MRNENGAWVVFNDTSSFTEVLGLPSTYEVCAVSLHIRTNEWERRAVEHEMFRGIGLSGPSFDDPRYGIAMLSPRFLSNRSASVTGVSILAPQPSSGSVLAGGLGSISRLTSRNRSW